jgi:ribonuclease M5
MINRKPAIVVEGRYDKSSLMGYLDAKIITTGGFSIFNDKEKQALLRRISQNGVILLTDSDGGGKQIRRFLQGIIPPENIHNLYIPKIEGKESRKRKASKAGTLGVEGMDKDVILRLLTPFAEGENCEKEGKMITKVDFFFDGLSGNPNSSAKREALCRALDLPHDMTANALIDALNLLYTYDEYKRFVDTL